MASMPTTEHRIYLTPAQRREILKNDEMVADFDQTHATCTKCGKIIKLKNKIEFNLTPWRKHRKTCKRKFAEGLPNLCPVVCSLFICDSL